MTEADDLDKITREVLNSTSTMLTPDHCYCHNVDFKIEDGCELCHENPTDCIKWFVDVFMPMDMDERREKYGW
jgi:hypothetical protein